MPYLFCNSKGRSSKGKKEIRPQKECGGKGSLSRPVLMKNGRNSSKRGKEEKRAAA